MVNENYTNEIYEMAIRWRCQILRGNLPQEKLKTVSEFVNEFSTDPVGLVDMLIVYRNI